MRLEQHTAVSLALAALVYACSLSWACAVSVAMAGVLIDVDHLLDFFLTYGFRLRIREFFAACHAGRVQTAILFLHGWEWIAVGAISAWLTNWNPWVSGATIGVGLHLVLDQFSNKPLPWTYSLLWRAAQRFRTAHIFPSSAAAQQ